MVGSGDGTSVIGEDIGHNRSLITAHTNMRDNYKGHSA